MVGVRETELVSNMTFFFHQHMGMFGFVALLQVPILVLANAIEMNTLLAAENGTCEKTLYSLLCS